MGGAGNSIADYHKPGNHREFVVCVVELPVLDVHFLIIIANTVHQECITRVTHQ